MLSSNRPSIPCDTSHWKKNAIIFYSNITSHLLHFSYVRSLFTAFYCRKVCIGPHLKWTRCRPTTSRSLRPYSNWLRQTGNAIKWNLINQGPIIYWFDWLSKVGVKANVLFSIKRKTISNKSNYYRTGILLAHFVQTLEYVLFDLLAYLLHIDQCNSLYFK